MTLASMHPMLQVSIDFCKHSSPNCVWKIPHSHIGVLAKPKLQWVPSWNCGSTVIGIWKCLQCQDWSPTVSLYLQIAATIFCDRQFLERPSLWRVGTLQSTFLLWSAVPKKNFFDGHNGIWQALKTSILNTALHHCKCLRWRFVEIYTTVSWVQKVRSSQKSNRVFNANRMGAARNITKDRKQWYKNLLQINVDLQDCLIITTSYILCQAFWNAQNGEDISLKYQFYMNGYACGMMMTSTTRNIGTPPHFAFTFLLFCNVVAWWWWWWSSSLSLLISWKHSGGWDFFHFRLQNSRFYS